MLAHHHTEGSPLGESWVQAGRLLTRWRRDRAVLMGSLLFPVSLMLVYEVVLGQRVRTVTGADSLYGLVPISALLSALFGSMGNSIGITLDRDSGLLTRMWILPVHRASAVTGRLTAEAARALIGTVTITILGLIMGMRFTHGLPQALLFIIVPSIVVIGFTALVMAVAIRINGRTAMTWLVGITVSLAFINPGITPIGLFPDWLRPFVRIQPMSPPIETMRALAYGGPLVCPLAMTLIWSVGLFAIFTPIAVRGYRKAAESGR